MEKSKGIRFAIGDPITRRIVPYQRYNQCPFTRYKQKKIQRRMLPNHLYLEGGKYVQLVKMLKDMFPKRKYDLYGGLDVDEFVMVDKLDEKAADFAKKYEKELLEQEQTAKANKIIKLIKIFKKMYKEWKDYDKVKAPEELAEEIEKEEIEVKPTKVIVDPTPLQRGEEKIVEKVRKKPPAEKPVMVVEEKYEKKIPKVVEELEKKIPTPIPKKKPKPPPQFPDEPKEKPVKKEPELPPLPKELLTETEYAPVLKPTVVTKIPSKYGVPITVIEKRRKTVPARGRPTKTGKRRMRKETDDEVASKYWIEKIKETLGDELGDVKFDFKIKKRKGGSSTTPGKLAQLMIGSMLGYNLHVQLDIKDCLQTEITEAIVEMDKQITYDNLKTQRDKLELLEALEEKVDWDRVEGEALDSINETLEKMELEIPITITELPDSVIDMTKNTYLDLTSAVMKPVK